MVTKRHRARKIALHLLYGCDVSDRRSEEDLSDQVGYLTREEIMLESIASDLAEEDVEQQVREILKDQERRQRLKRAPRPKNPEAERLCAFALELAKGVLDFRDEIDKRLKGVSEHWRLGRMPAVDRNILRLGAYELLYRPDIPPKVSIDEAVELAKEYGDDKSGAFVNGILDVIAAERLKQQEGGGNGES